MKTMNVTPEQWDGLVDKNIKLKAQLAAKDAEIDKYKKALERIRDDRLSHPLRPQVPTNSYAFRLIKLVEQALSENKP